MEEKIDILLFKTDGSYEEIAVLNELNELQKLVGGYIETVTISNEIILICDEEGRIKNKRSNPHLRDICGDFILCGADGENFRSLTEKEKYILIKTIFGPTEYRKKLSDNWQTQ